MKPGPEQLGALLDGELSPDDARKVEAAVAADPALAAELAMLRRADEALRAAFPAPAPADAALLARLGLAEPEPMETTAPRSAEVIDLASARAARVAPAPPRRWATPGRRIAASIALVAVVGLSAGAWMQRRPVAADSAPYSVLADRTASPRADALVMVREGVDAATVVRAAGGRLVGSRTSAGAWRIAAEPGQGRALLERLRQDDRVVLAEPIGAGDQP